MCDRESRRRDCSKGADVLRFIYLLLGLLFVALGLIGALLPVVPTTPFLILALACFARSSRRLERWLLDHPRFGQSLRAWRKRGAVPFRAKLLSLCGVTAGFTVFWFASDPDPWLAAAVAVFMATGVIYVFSRPS